MANQPILRVEGLRKSFGGLRAVDGVDLSVETGQIHAIIGPNGSGKTTFFNLITGHLTPDAGRVWFDGREITRLPSHECCRRGMARSFQRTNIFPRLTVFENVQVSVLASQGKCLNMFGPAKNMARDESMAILESVGLSTMESLPSSVLSHGDQKRLELAIALGNQPKLLLLDEPTSGMSPQETADTIKLIESVCRSQGLTLLFTEHDMNVVFSIAERLTVLHQGRVIASGTPQEVRADPEAQRVYLGEPV